MKDVAFCTQDNRFIANGSIGPVEPGDTVILPYGLYPKLIGETMLYTYEVVRIEGNIIIVKELRR